MTLGTTLRRALGLLARNPVLLLPNVAIGALAGTIEALLAPARPDALPTSHAGIWISDAIGIVSSVVAVAIGTGMADAAWRNGRARLADGTRAFRRECGHVAVAMIATALLGYLAAVLAPYTAFLSMFVWAFLSIYAIASAVAGEREGFLALRESAELSLRRPLTTLAMIVALAIVVVVATLTSAALAGIAGSLAGGVLTQLSLTYLSVVIVGEYETLRAFGGPAAARGRTRGSDAVERE